MAASSMKASLLSVDGSQKRECYVSTPAPKFIKKHRDLWKHAWNSDLELPLYSDDVLFFGLQEVCDIPRIGSSGAVTALPPEQLAIYHELPKDTAKAMMAMEAQKAAVEAQFKALERAAALKATEEMLAQQAAQANLAGWAKKPVKWVGVNNQNQPISDWNPPTAVTNVANTLPSFISIEEDAMEPYEQLAKSPPVKPQPKPTPEPVKPKPDPLESQIPDPEIPKRRMMKK